MQNRTTLPLLISFVFLVPNVASIAHEGHDHGSEKLHLTRATVGNPAGTFRNRVSIEIEGGYRVIRSNGLPSHATGRFPGPGNPNSIREQDHQFRLPANPKPAESATSLRLGKFGVALNGIPIDPGAAEFWRRDFSSPWQYAVINGKINLGIDLNQAHVQPSGEYHYHGRPLDLIKQLRAQAHQEGKSMTLIGYAADGFPIYDCDIVDQSGTTKTLTGSYELKKGSRPSGADGPGGKYDGTFLADWEYVPGSGDLDEFNGRSGTTPEYPEGTFFYVLTKDFPYVPRKFKGTPNESFAQRGPGGRRGPRRSGPRRSGPPGSGPPGSGPPGFGPPGFRPPPPPPPRRRESNR